MTVTLRAIKSRHRHKNKNSPNPEFPCEIEAIVTHNHDVDTPDDLKFRPVCDEVRQSLIDLYQVGHTPATALEILKMNIRLTCEDYEKVLLDRRYCPSYQHCYYVYSCFKEEYEPLDFTSRSKEVLEKMVNTFNENSKERSAEIFVEENNYIICICSPMMKRVHEHVTYSSQTVIVDTYKSVDGSKIFILLTPSESGGLPLGIIVTSSGNSESLSVGLHLLKYMVGDVMFHGSPDGPEIFLTGDNPMDTFAIKSVWPKSQTFLCSFDILQTVWRWLIKTKNNIPQEIQHYLFQEFKAILYAGTPHQCSDLYTAAKESAKAYANYGKFLEDLWRRKESWALCFRQKSLNEICSEVAIKFQKEKIFHNVRSFNIIQMVHFLTTKFLDYYETRLLNVAHNQLDKNVLDKPFVRPPEGFVEKIQYLNDNMALVPSEDEDLFYIVNMDALVCTCFTISTVRLCKHIDWACCLIYSQKFLAATDNVVTRTIYYKIATGENPEWLLPFTNLETDDSPITLIYIPEAEVPIEEKLDVENNDVSCSPDRSDSPDCPETPMDAVTCDDFTSCQQVMEQFVQILTPFCQKSPHLMLPALEKLKEQASSLTTVPQMVSACSSFGLDCSQVEMHKDREIDELPIREESEDQLQRTSSGCKIFKIDAKSKKTILGINKKGYFLSKQIIQKLRESNR